MNFLDHFNEPKKKHYFLNLEVGDRVRLQGKDKHPHYHGVKINGEIVQVFKPVTFRDPVRYEVLLENGDIVPVMPTSIIRVFRGVQHTRDQGYTAQSINLLE